MILFDPPPCTHRTPTADCSLVDDIYTYNFVSQGKITIPSMDDSEEMGLTDVRMSWWLHQVSLFHWLLSGETSSLRNFTLASTPLSFSLKYLSSSVGIVVIQMIRFLEKKPWHPVVCQSLSLPHFKKEFFGKKSLSAFLNLNWTNFYLKFNSKFTFPNCSKVIRFLLDVQGCLVQHVFLTQLIELRECSTLSNSLYSHCQGIVGWICFGPYKI